MTERIRLTDRVVLSVIGPDAESFLNGLLTNSTQNMELGQVRYGALLTPQGKIISDMIYQRIETGFLLDAADQSDETLLKRLKMFKLRAEVDITLCEDLAVYAFDREGFSDPRSDKLPKRGFHKPHKADPTSAHKWRAARIKAGVAQQGHDFSESEVFPADVNMDLMGGVDFKKGCFVGQEVVSRMKRRGVARRRTLVFRFDLGAPHVGTPIKAGDTVIGELTSVEDDYALARIRIDRLGKAMAEDASIVLSASERAAELVPPDWLDAEIEALLKAKE